MLKRVRVTPPVVPGEPPVSTRMRSVAVSTTHAHIGSGSVKPGSRAMPRIRPNGPPCDGLPSRNVGLSCSVPVEMPTIFITRAPVADGDHDRRFLTAANEQYETRGWKGVTLHLEVAPLLREGNPAHQHCTMVEHDQPIARIDSDPRALVVKPGFD